MEISASPKFFSGEASYGPSKTGKRQALPLRRPQVVQLIAARLDGVGADTTTILRRAGIDPGTLNDPFFKVELKKVHSLLDLAAPVLGSPNLGIEIGRNVTPQKRGLFGYILMNAPTLDVAIKDYMRYVAAFRRGLIVGLTGSGDFRDLTMTAEDPDLRGHRLHIDCYTAVTVAFLRALIGEDWSPVEAHFQYGAPPSGTQALEDYFRCDLHFGRPLNAIRLRAADLSRQTIDADPNIYDFLKDAAEATLRQFPNEVFPVNRVRSMILASLQHGGLNIPTAAAGLGMSARTLQRALAEQGTTFREVSDSTRRQLAIELLRNSELALMEVAYLIGYADASAFNHAFRRWTGQTPLGFRRKRT